MWILRLDLSGHLHTGRPPSHHQDRVCVLDLRPPNPPHCQDDDVSSLWVAVAMSHLLDEVFVGLDGGLVGRHHVKLTRKGAVGARTQDKVGEVDLLQSRGQVTPPAGGHRKSPDQPCCMLTRPPSRTTICLSVSTPTTRPCTKASPNVSANGIKVRRAKPARGQRSKSAWLQVNANISSSPRHSRKYRQHTQTTINITVITIVITMIHKSITLQEQKYLVCYRAEQTPAAPPRCDGRRLSCRSE